MEFVSSEEFDLLRNGDRDILNEVLSRVYNKAVEAALQMTPEVTAQMIKSSVNLRRISDKFFKDNPGFTAHKDVVQKVVRDIEAAHPRAGYEEVLRLATPEIMQKLRLIGA